MTTADAETWMREASIAGPSAMKCAACTADAAILAEFGTLDFEQLGPEGRGAWYRIATASLPSETDGV